MHSIGPVIGPSSSSQDKTAARAKINANEAHRTRLSLRAIIVLMLVEPSLGAQHRVVADVFPEQVDVKGVVVFDKAHKEALGHFWNGGPDHSVDEFYTYALGVNRFVVIQQALVLLKGGLFAGVKGDRVG